MTLNHLNPYFITINTLMTYISGDGITCPGALKSGRAAHGIGMRPP